jgi:hypothetical protein
MMMKFRIGEKFKERSAGFEYLQDEFSINSREIMQASFGGILFNDLALEIGDDGEVLNLSGLCAHTLWRRRDLELPKYTCRKMTIESLPALLPGVYSRFNDIERMPVYADPSRKLLCVGQYDACGEVVCFLPGAVMVLVQGIPTSLWLFEVEGMPIEKT